MDKLATKWAELLIQNGADAENKEIYVYGMECLLNELISNAIVFIIAFAFGFPLEMLIWNVFFLPLRVNIGGYHAKSHLSCVLTSSIVAIGCVAFVKNFVHIFWLVIPLALFSIIVTFTIAPIVHPNRGASETRKIGFKRTGRIVCVIEALLIFLLYAFYPNQLLIIASSGMFTAAIMCLIGWVEAKHIS